MQTEVYLSGRFTVNTEIEQKWLKRTGCKHRCFSFAFVNEAKPVPGFLNPKCVQALKVCEKAKVKIMMDSGAFSIHTMKVKLAKQGLSKIDIEAKLIPIQKKMFDSYVAYCHQHKHLWEFYVGMDFKQDQTMIYDMQQKFLKEKLEPMPVYHGDSGTDWLLKHKDMGHSYIAVGGGRLHPGKNGLRHYFDKVFNFGAKHGLVYHGLAMTSMPLITTWPFKSVDSSTWSRTAAFGLILYPDVRKKKFLNIHVSSKYCRNAHSHHDMTKKHRDELKEFLAFHGFDLELMKDNESERHDWNGYLMSNLHKFDVFQSNRKSWGTLL